MRSLNLFASLPSGRFIGLVRAARVRDLRPLALALLLAGMAASAQAPADVRVALVIGNSAYPAPAALVNPANDATAMAGALRRLGFSVVEVRDGTREQMAQAVQTVRNQLRGKQGVGMLYYAGHGLQLDWRNYMVPVDARLNSAADVAAQALDIDNVINAFKTAGNRMNIVVLDACRDNPFADTSTGKGLAQLDAPPGTFLAFATAPGNVAEDGVGQSNGLYTGFLVQELTRPAAKIEDVFKRVRFAVRRASNGRQIPWESTSLEDDFYFNDGQRYTFRVEDLQAIAAEARRKEEELKRQAEAARERERQLAQQIEEERRRATEQAARAAAEERARLEAAAREREQQLALAREQERQRAEAAARQAEQARRAEEERLREVERARQEAEARSRQRLNEREAQEKAFAEEKADWDRIASSRDPDDFYRFLARWPSGQISELASATLERLQAAQIKRTANKDGVVQVAARDRFRVGDMQSGIMRDDLTKITRPFQVRVTAVNEDTVELGGGVTLLTREGGTIRNRFIARMDPPRLDLPAGDYVVGNKWKFRSRETSPTGESWNVSGEVRVVALEDVTVPAGSFKAYRLVLESFSDNGTRVKLTRWMLPDSGFPVKTLREIRPRSGAPTLETYETTQLVRGRG